MDAWLRIIGDIHGHKPAYKILTQNCEYSIQIGDLAFEYDWLNDLDVTKHRFLPGNHDNMDLAPLSPYCLGDFGVYSVPDFSDIFYVRGGFSVDHKLRRAFPQYDRGKILPQNFWLNEELSVRQLNEAIDLYTQVKPRFLIAHEAPISIVPLVSDPQFIMDLGYSGEPIKTRTNMALQNMIEIHKPEIIVFGHYHVDFDQIIDGTRFVCANTRKTINFQKDHFNK